jgi:predicted DNA-binding transcriptional regulator AlpA
MFEFEGTLRAEEGSRGTQEGQEGRGDTKLLSITDVCKALGMGKSWTYRRLKSRGILNIKLERNIKIKRRDLE